MLLTHCKPFKHLENLCSCMLLLLLGQDETKHSDICSWIWHLPCNKWEIMKTPITLQPLSLLAFIWMDVYMDLIKSFPNLGENSVIMVVVDRIFKYYHFCALPHPFNPTLVAQIFINQTLKLHRMPTSIVSNRDPTFTKKIGRNYSNYMVHRSKWIQHINPKQMIKLK